MRVFHCCTVCEVNDCKKFHLIMWTNYKQLCNSFIVGQYVKGSSDVNHCGYNGNGSALRNGPLIFSFCKIPRKLSQ